MKNKKKTLLFETNVIFKVISGPSSINLALTGKSVFSWGIRIIINHFQLL